MPIAEQAQERYNLGTVSNNMPKMFPTLLRRLSGMRNIKATTVQGKPGLFSNAASISLITGQQYNGRPDTVYVETPKHMPFMNVQPRMAGQNVGPDSYSMEEANEYNVLGRRFNLAKSVSAKQLGGTMSQQGAQPNIEQQVVQLVQAAVLGDQKATQQIEQIMQAAQLGDQQAIQIALVIQKVIQSMKAKQGVKAQLGAKLDYLNKLKGICPEGSEKVYLKNGGCMCKQKAAEGAELKKEQPKNEILKFKAEKKACGSKLKKKEVTKHWEGGLVSRGGLTNQSYSGEWGDRGLGNEIQSAIENGLTWLYKTFINPDKDPNVIGGTAMVPGLGKAKNAAEALKMVQAMKALKAAKAAQAVKPTLPKSINESGLTRSGKNNLNSIINALPENERLSVTDALLNHQKFWNDYGNGLVNVSPNRAASIINAIRRKLGFSGLGNTYLGAVKYGTLRSGFKEGLTEDATSLTTGIGRTTKLKPE